MTTLLHDPPIATDKANMNLEYRELKNLVFWIFATLIPLTALTVIAGILSDSLAIASVAVGSIASLLLHLFNMKSIGIILSQNTFNYPYGTGKLENFSGFLYAAIVVPGALFIIYSAFDRFMHPSLTEIDFGIVQALLAITLARDVWFLRRAARICRRFPDFSPMTGSYRLMMKLAMVEDISIFAGMFLGYWILAAGHGAAAVMADLIVAVIAASYMMYCAIDTLVRNFRSLVDMPLPEAEQLLIINALTADFDSWEGIGNIYSQLSGSTRMIQIELYVDADTKAREIEALQCRIRERLLLRFNKLQFHLIPLVKKDEREI
jgi:cation diffusion facilitator family transporter